MDELIIEAGQSEAHYWRDLWQYRDLYYFLAWRDLLVRYKQTIFGVLRAVVRPFVTRLWRTCRTAKGLQWARDTGPNHAGQTAGFFWSDDRVLDELDGCPEIIGHSDAYRPSRANTSCLPSACPTSAGKAQNRLWPAETRC